MGFHIQFVHFSSSKTSILFRACYRLYLIVKFEVAFFLSETVLEHWNTGCQGSSSIQLRSDMHKPPFPTLTLMIFKTSKRKCISHHLAAYICIHNNLSKANIYSSEHVQWNTKLLRWSWTKYTCKYSCFKTILHIKKILPLP